MKGWHQFRRFIGFVAVAMIVTGCTYQAAIQRLTPAEQTEFRTYRKVMSWRQGRTYLSRTTTAERKAYLEAIGITSRFQALSPEDRAAVLDGFPRTGLSADALRFLWGEPYWTTGYPNHYEYWYYLGSVFTLVNDGNDYTSRATVVEVYLVDSKVVWWIETVPNDEDDDHDHSIPG
jgi:hypothetical protein